ncbi:MAG: 50S ribosomal protein L25/general stress protein Ctc [Desulfobacterales bacterium]
MEFIELNAEARQTVGNSPARKLRRDGKLPGILYGPDTEPALIAIDAHDFQLALKAGSVNALFNLILAGDSKPQRRVMIKELQAHPVSQTPLHVDFYEIAMDRKINVKVPVVPVGKSVGVEMGGLLQVVRREIEVYCLPDKIPESFIIDISELEVGGSIHIEEIPLPEGVEISSEANFTVITVLSPKVEEVEEEDEGLEEGLEEEAAESEDAEGDEAS